MGLVLFVLFTLFLATKSFGHQATTISSSCSPSTNHQDGHDRRTDKSGIHLTLHHLYGPCSPLSASPQSLLDHLHRDEARVRTLYSRLTRASGTSTSSFKSVVDPRPKSGFTPLNSSMGGFDFYVNIDLGTPSESYMMSVDTGSTLTWLQCKPCAQFCHSQVGPLYDPLQSSTHEYISCQAQECFALEAATLNAPSCDQNNTCTYDAAYGDGSYSTGYLTRDTLSVAGYESLPGFVFGCGQNNEGLFGEMAGLIGLSRGKLSMLGQVSGKYGNIFSYCLPSSDAYTGTLSIGHSSFNESMYTFTPMIEDRQEPDLYFLRLTGVTVVGIPLNVSSADYNTSTVIDSGTAISRLPSAVYVALTETFREAIVENSTLVQVTPITDKCYNVSSGELVVPEIKLIFEGGAEMKLGAQNILMEVDDGVKCLAFADNDDTDGLAIIGNRQQLTFDVAYDVGNSRIGFAAGGCN